MANFKYILSTRFHDNNGKCAIIIQIKKNQIRMRANSGLYVSPNFFEWFIDWNKTNAKAGAHGYKVKQTNETTATQEKAERMGYVLQGHGIINIRQRVETPEVKEHQEIKKQLEDLTNEIDERLKKPNNHFTLDWLQNCIGDIYRLREKADEEQKKANAHNLIYPYIEKYVKKRQLAEPHGRVYFVLSRAIARYEGFVRKTDNKRRDFIFDIDKVTRENIEDFSDYLRNEKQLSEEYPAIFKELLNNYPNDVRKGNHVIEARGENTVIKMRTRLKSVFRFCLEEGYTNNRPFDGVKIGVCKVGTPYYITIDERNKIAETDLSMVWDSLSKDEIKAVRMPLKTLCEQRDIFVFQCLIGCRVGDLLTMTEQHIHNGLLVYTPHKTKDEGKEAMQARVPLHQKALALIEKYRGIDKHGRLFPFISAQKYNLAIKTIFRMAGVTRNVEIRNPKTGENEVRPINEVATSHLARRTFIGGLYFRVADPNLIGKMSGHVEGSKAFKRYRNIEDETLQDIINNNLG